MALITSATIKSNLRSCALLEIWGQVAFQPGDQIYDLGAIELTATSLRIECVLPPEGRVVWLEIDEPRGLSLQKNRLTLKDAKAIRWAGLDHPRKPAQLALSIQ